MLKKKAVSFIMSAVLVVTMLLPIMSTTVSAYYCSNGLYDGTYSSDPGQYIANIALANVNRDYSSLGYSGSWCAKFVSDVCAKAGQSAAVPSNAGVSNLRSAIISAGGYQVSAADVRAGDIAILNGTGHCGICLGTYVQGTYYWNGAWRSHSGNIVDGNNTNISGGYVQLSKDSFFSNITYYRPNYYSHTHSYSGYVTTNPTCTATGIRTYTCSCGSSYTESIAALGHSFGELQQCESGQITHTCTNCGIVENYVTDVSCFKYEISNGEVTITGYIGSDTAVVIPSTIDGYPVTAIGDSAFSFCGSLISVTIPDSVTSIGGRAFERCISLTSVTIPNSVTSIGEGAFLGCSSLSEILVESENPEYSSADGVLFNKDKTELLCCPAEKGGNYVIPNGVTSIGYYAFENCSSLTSVTIPDSVTSIGNGAFGGCGSLTSVTIPNSVTSIGDDAFSYCGSLTSITISDGVTSIGDSAFDSCSSLTSVTIGNSVTSIGGWAFNRCSSLTSVTIPNSVTSIGVRAFWLCSSLTSVTIGNGVTSIGYYAFDNCSSLIEININSGNQNYSSEEGILFNKDKTKLICCPEGRSGEYSIPDSVTSIGDGAFQECSRLTSIIMSDSVTSIGGWAFDRCSSLTSVTIPNSVTSIGDSAFYDCESLADVYYYGTEVQWNSIAIGDYNDPLNNATIHYATENSCDDFEYEISNGEVTITGYIGSDTAVVIPSTIEGYPVTAIGDMAFYECSSLTSITIPDSVKSIGYDAFSTCSRLTSITIPDSVTSIGGYAFSHCSSLTSITIPDSVTSIGDNLFRFCHSLTSITIPDSVTSIGDCAFYGCSGLTSITIPNSVTSIGEFAFYCCINLERVEITDISSWCKINFSDEISNPLYHGGNLYLNGIKVADIVLSNVITCINNYAFYGSSSLTSITIPDSVTSIGNSSFSYCSSLTSITIPNSVTSIGDYAFYACESLADVYYLGTEEQWNSISIGEGNDSLNNAMIHYVNFVYGDANGDGVINGQDVVRLEKYLANYDYDTETSTTEITSGADANGDGVINGQDVVRLEKYLANYDYETNTSTIVLGPQN